MKSISIEKHFIGAKKKGGSGDENIGQNQTDEPMEPLAPDAVQEHKNTDIAHCQDKSGSVNPKALGHSHDMTESIPGSEIEQIQIIWGANSVAKRN